MWGINRQRNVDLTQTGNIFIKYTWSQLESKMTIGKSELGTKSSCSQWQCILSALEKSKQAEVALACLKLWEEHADSRIQTVSYERQECPLFPEEHCQLKKKIKSFFSNKIGIVRMHTIFSVETGESILPHIENRFALVRHWVTVRAVNHTMPWNSLHLCHNFIIFAITKWVEIWTDNIYKKNYTWKIESWNNTVSLEINTRKYKQH